MVFYYMLCVCVSAHVTVCILDSQFSVTNNVVHSYVRFALVCVCIFVIYFVQHYWPIICQVLCEIISVFIHNSCDLFNLKINFEFLHRLCESTRYSMLCVDIVGDVTNNLSVPRSRRILVEKIVEMGLVADRKELHRKRRRKDESVDGRNNKKRRQKNEFTELSDLVSDEHSSSSSTYHSS